MRRVPAFATAVCVAASGLVAAGPSGSAAAAPDAAAAQAALAAPMTAAVAKVHWKRCADPSLRQFKARCAFVKVPLDYSRPHGKKIKLAVSRVRHTVKKSKYQGVMLVNPGGPGGSGLSLSVLGPIISKSFGRKDAGGAYDWIGFDPRGVGASKPSLSCNPNYFGPDRPDYTPSTPALLHVWQARSRGYARACDRKTGHLLDNMRTTDIARDMDQIRAALGKRQINYYGFSFGTYLAQVYTRLFPSRMRRMVLDSNVDPRNVWYDANLAQDVAFERNLTLFFAWVARHNGRYHLGATGRTVERRWFAVKRQLAAAPIAGQVGPDEWADVFLFAGYAQFLWPDFGDLFANWVNKADGKPVIDAYLNFDTVGDDNGYVGYLATSCTDAKWKNRDFIGDNWKTHYRAPFFTWGNAWFNGPCNYWPAKAGTPLRITGAGVGDALLIDETRDAATPYEGSRFLRSIYRDARLVAVTGGTSHAVTPSGNACVDNKIFNYLADGKLPKRRSGGGADVKCDAPPKPSPNPPAPAAFGFATSTGALAKAVDGGSLDAGRALLARLLMRADRF